MVARLKLKGIDGRAPPGVQSSLKALRELCKELGVPKHGSKQEVLS